MHVRRGSRTSAGVEPALLPAVIVPIVVPLAKQGGHHERIALGG
jgi:hypothetical protein